jgi:multiple sugar transport system substrate-binding protein
MLNRSMKVIGVSTVCLSVLLAGCSSKPAENTNGAPAAAKEEPKTLRIGVESWMVEKLLINEAVAKFKAKHPDINVTIAPYADKSILSNFALQWSQNKTDVDVVVVDGTASAVQYLAKDLVVDFNKTEFFTGNTTKDKFVGKTLSFGDLDGVQFAIPISLEAYAINVNTTMFKEAGLTDAQGKIINPKNWQEIYEYAKKMTIKDGSKVTQQGMTIQWGPNALYTLMSAEQAALGTFYKDNVISFDTPEIRDILKIWKKGADEGVFSIDTFTNKDAGRNTYKAGQVAMLLESGSRAPEAAPTVGAENVTVIPIPGSVEKGSAAFAAGILVPKATPAPKLAVQFIQEALMDVDVQGDTATKWGKLPVINEAYALINADWKSTLQSIINKSVTPPFYKEYPVLDKNIPIQLQNYLTGKIDLEAFIKETEKMIKEIDKNTK